MQNISITSSVGDTSLYLPSDSFKIVQLKKPQIIPCVIEVHSGINNSAKKAGMASSSLFQFIFLTGVIINTPTRTRAGAVAMVGTTDRSGEKNMNGKKPQIFILN